MDYILINNFKVDVAGYNQYVDKIQQSVVIKEDHQGDCKIHDEKNLLIPIDTVDDDDMMVIDNMWNVRCYIAVRGKNLKRKTHGKK